MFLIVISFGVTAIKKKLLTVGQQKECERVKEWMPSINNHLYWVAASSAGDCEQMQAKWESLIYHLQDQHTNLPNPLFPACAHPPLLGRDRKKLWLKPRMYFATWYCLML